MQHPHASRRFVSTGALAALTLCLATPVRAQMDMSGQDPASVERHLETVRAYLAEMEGPIAERLFAMRATQRNAPLEFPLTPALPHVPAQPAHPSALGLLHYQAVRGGGSLGRLHGPATHPIGVGWFPHSMFAQGGGLYARWGFERLLDAVDRFAALQREG